MTPEQTRGPLDAAMKVIRFATCRGCPYIETRTFGSVIWCPREDREIENPDIMQDWCPLEDWKEADDA